MPHLTTLLRAGEGALRHLSFFADSLADPAETHEDAPTGLRVAIVFADIEGFSELVAAEGDDVGALILDQLDTVVADATTRHPSARLVKQLGDGVMLAIDNPLEAMALTAELPPAFATATAGTSHPMRLRSGAHQGTVLPRGNDLIGYHVNVAARVAASAEGGQALITGALLSAAATIDPATAGRGGTVLPVVASAGVLDAKGVPERPPLYAVTPARSAGPTAAAGSPAA